MNHFHWQCHCTADERRKVQPFSEAVDDGGEETETDAADHLVFTRVRAGATEPVFIVSKVVRGRETECVRAGTEKLLDSANAFSLPLFHARPGESDQSKQLSDWDSILLAFRSAKQRALRSTFVEQKATSTHHRTSSRSLHGDTFRVRTTTEPTDGLQHQDADQASRPSSPSLSGLLASGQQYLQALRENMSPPPALREAWEAFYRTYDPLVRRTVAACSLNRADADDCAQEAWAEITTKLTRFEYDPDRGSFESWLRIVVHRAACNYARRDQRQTAGRIDQDLTALTCPRILGPVKNSQREELRASVRQTLHAFRTSVSSTAFQILIMTAVHGQTSTEIGKLLGLTPGHVRVSRHRTAKKFRQFVAGEPGLAEAFGVSMPPNKAVEIRGDQPPDEQFSELSRNCRDSL